MNALHFVPNLLLSVNTHWTRMSFTVELLTVKSKTSRSVKIFSRLRQVTCFPKPFPTETNCLFPFNLHTQATSNMRALNVKVDVFTKEDTNFSQFCSYSTKDLKNSIEDCYTYSRNLKSGPLECYRRSTFITLTSFMFKNPWTLSLRFPGINSISLVISR